MSKTFYQTFLLLFEKTEDRERVFSEWAELESIQFIHTGRDYCVESPKGSVFASLQDFFATLTFASTHEDAAERAQELFDELNRLKEGCETPFKIEIFPLGWLNEDKESIKWTRTVSLKQYQTDYLISN